MPGELPPPDPAKRDRYEPEPYAIEPASVVRLRRVLIAVGGLTMVVFAVGLGLLVLRDNGDSSRPPGAVGAAPPEVANPTEAPITAAPNGTAPTIPTAANTPSATGTASTTVATRTATSTPTTTAQTGPPATTRTATSTPTITGTTSTTVASRTATSTPTTTAPTGPPATTGPPAPASAPDPSTDAVATAQALVDALVDGRWNDARVLNPGRNESDAFLQTAYGPIEEATVVPAAVTLMGDDRYDMRLGIVAHENQPTGQRTVLMCVHWQVDLDTKTVLRIASARLRVEGGYVPPNSRASELSTACASIPLK